MFSRRQFIKSVYNATGVMLAVSPHFLRAAQVESYGQSLLKKRMQASDINIAIAGPMSGPDAHNGELMRNAAKVYADFINAHKGILGRQLTVPVQDDGDDPRQAPSVANQLIGMPPIVIGHAVSGTAIPAAKVYDENETILLSPVNAENFIQGTSPYIFRIIPPNSVYARHVCDELIASNKSKIAVIHNGTDYGKGFADLLQSDMHSKGMADKIKYFDPTSNADQDFHALIEKYAHSGIDAVVLAMIPMRAGQLMRQALDRGFISSAQSNEEKPLVIGHSALVSADFHRTSVGASEGTLVVSVSGCDPNILAQDLQSRTTTTEIIELYRKNGFDPYDITQVIIFSAFEIATQAIMIANSLDTKLIAEVLHTHTFNTLRGTIKFADSGEFGTPPENSNDGLALYRITATGQPRLLKTYQKQMTPQ